MVGFDAGEAKMVRLRVEASRLELLEARRVPILASEDASVAGARMKSAADELLRGVPLGAEHLYLSLNDPNTHFAVFAFPKMPAKEIRETLKWKMREELAFPVENAFFDFRLFETKAETKTTGCSALVAALPKDALAPYLEALPQLDVAFQPINIAFSISSLPKCFPRAQDMLTVVMDIGRTVTEIAFYERGKINFLRKILYGTDHWIRALTQSITTEKGSVALAVEEAETVLKDESLLGAAPQKTVFGKLNVSQLFPLFRPEVEKLEQEIKRSLDYYFQEHGACEAEIFVTGGGSAIQGLLPYLESVLQVPVHPVTIRSEITLAESLQGKDLSTFTRLLLLAMDRKDETHSALARAERSVTKVLRKLSYTTAAVVLVCVIGGLLTGMFFRYRQIQKKTQELNSQVENLKGGFGQSQQIQAAEQKVNQGKTLISLLLEKEPEWEEVFRELAQGLPSNAVITSAAYERNNMVITGLMTTSGGGEASVSNILREMEGPIFRKPQLVKTEWHEGKAHFTIRCEVT